MDRRLRDHTFQNPIIPGFHPDPSICRVGSDFYLVTSSFEYFPGIPVFHSRDLVSWRQLGHVLTRKSQLKLDRTRSSGGIYAPTLRHFGGRYYVIATHVGGKGHFYVTAQDPRGPWSEPVWIDAGGIDPSLFFDDGAVYFTRNGKGPDADHPLIYQAKLDLEKGKLAGRPRAIWAGTGGIWPEGPHLYKIGTTYYLMIAEGGTGYGHSETIARSSSPFGALDVYPNNPILSHRHRAGHPIQAVGHADLVELADGNFWAVFLGIRPKNGRHHHLGRETFLAPVTWTRDGWPIVGQGGHVELEMAAPRLPPAPVPPAPERDDFDQPELAPVWNFLRNPNPRDWSLTERVGHLRLRGSPVTLDDVDSPALVVRRQQHFRVRCRAAIEFRPGHAREEAGLTIRGNERFHYDLAVRGGAAVREVVLRRRVRGESRVVSRRPLDGGTIVLEVSATESEYVFRAGAKGRMQTLGALPTKTLSAEVIGASGQNYFTGAFFGLYATGNGAPSTAPADFDWFEYRASSDGA